MAKRENYTTMVLRLREMLPELRRRYGVRSLAIFGSRVSGTARKSSDLDLLVSFDEAPGLFKFIELENELTEALGLKVDLVMEDALKARLRPRIMAEAVPI